MADDVHGVGQPDNGIAHELARTMPGDLASPVDVDHRRSVAGSLIGFCAFARRVHGLVLEKDDGVWRPPVDHGSVHCTLLFEGVEIRHGVGA